MPFLFEGKVTFIFAPQLLVLYKFLAKLAGREGQISLHALSPWQENWWLNFFPLFTLFIKKDK